MKPLFLLGLLISVLIFQSCKNNTTNQEEVTLDETEQIAPHNVDSTAIETTIENIEDTSSIVSETVKSGTTSKEVITTEVKTTKTIEKTVKPIVVETKPVVKENPNEPEVVVVEKPITKPVEEKPVAKPVEEKPIAKPVEEKPIAVTDPTEWIVPAKYKTMKNPTDAKDSENLAIGKSLYAKQCSSCHGKKGWGDGSKAPEMKGDLGDFSSKKTQGDTDGELYYKITFGRNDMPGFDKKIPSEEDRWLVVNFLRTLAK